MAEAGIIHLTEENWQAFLESNNVPVPVLALFGAEWCAPCKQMERVIRRIIDTQVGSARIYAVHIDIDALPEVAEKFDVASVPTIKFLKLGRVTAEMVGAQTLKTLENEIKRQLS